MSGSLSASRIIITTIPTTTAEEFKAFLDDFLLGQEAHFKASNPVRPSTSKLAEGITVSGSLSTGQIEISAPFFNSADEIRTCVNYHLFAPKETSLEERISNTVEGFKQKAEAGDEEALSALCSLAFDSTIALNSFENCEAMKKIASKACLWPVLSSYARTAQEANKKFFENIRLGVSRTDIDITELMKQGSVESSLALYFYTEITRMREGAQLYECFLENPSFQQTISNEAPIHLILSSTVSIDEIKDLTQFVNRLKSRADQVSALLWQKSSEIEQRLLWNYEPRQSDAREIQEIIALVLNRTLRGPCIYTDDLYKNIPRRPETIKLLEENPTGSDLMRLNRLLIEDAYPAELTRKQFSVKKTPLPIELLRDAGALPPFSVKESSFDAWWAIAEKLLMLATGGKPEEIEAFHKKYEPKAQFMTNPSSWMRAEIKSKFKKAFRRIARSVPTLTGPK